MPKALTLPEAERAKLAHALVKSLDASSDADATDEWDKELLRRLTEIDRGTATLVNRGVFHRHPVVWGFMRGVALRTRAGSD